MLFKSCRFKSCDAQNRLRKEKSNMDDQVLLVDSIICRLCAEDNINGTPLFCNSENEIDLSTTVNSYLPIKVTVFKQYIFIMVYNLISYVIFSEIKAEIQNILMPTSQICATILNYFMWNII